MLEDQRPPHLGSSITEFKFRRQHSYDRIVATLYGQQLANPQWVAVKQPLPEPVADDDAGSFSRLVVIPRKRSSQLSLRPEHRKEIGRHEGARHLLCLRIASERKAFVAIGRRFLKHRVLFAPV